MGDNPIFVTGCPKSGTNLCVRLLSNADDICLDSDMHQAWFFMDYVHKCLTSKIIMQDRHDRLNPRLQELADPTNPKFADLCKEYFMLLHSGSQKGRRWGNTSKPLIFFADILLNWWPSTQFIYMLRDPRDVYSSLKNSNWLGQEEFRDITHAMTIYINYYEKQKQVKNLVVINYHELVKDPKIVYEKLSIDAPEDYLKGTGLTYACRSLPTPKNVIADGIYNRVGRWKTDLTKDEIHTIETICRRILDENNNFGS